ncbi:MAG TPA: GNAT family N-acetyltransferase [Solirubrobacteraceae bacterium]
MAAGQAALRWVAAPAELDGALALRKRVFCDEQGVPVEEEIDGRDGEAEHLVALDPDDGSVIGTLRLLFDAGTVKVGRVAVERERRRRGIAGAMLAQALERARARGCVRARLAAQVDAVAVYERAGFAVCSAQFEEAGIPHVWMEQSL